MSYKMIDVRESARYVMENADYVAIDEKALLDLAGKLLPVPLPPWDYTHHYYDGTARTVSYFLLVDALNFCFFPAPRWEVIVAGERLQGYFGLTAVLKEAFLDGRPIDDFEHLSHIGAEEVREILHGKVPIGKIPLFPERVRIMREIGAQMTARYAGNPKRLVEAAGRSALKLVELVLEAFPSFRDEAEYKREKVAFYKRAQILAGDLYGCFKGRSYGEFHDIDRLTAFADYKLPQILRAAEVLRYAAALAERVDRKEWIPAGSAQEVEIRAATLVAVERLRDALVKRGRDILSVELDWLLWHAAQNRTMPPHHRTLTTFY